MPPKGYKKGYVKNPDTGEWVDPRTLVKPEPKVTVIKAPPKKKLPLPEPIKNVQDDSQHVKVIISWRDKKGKLRTTQYVMSTLELHESLTDSFSGAKKQTRIHLSLDGDVLEKI
jgi:hypothetical protein